MKSEATRKGKEVEFQTFVFDFVVFDVVVMVVVLRWEQEEEWVNAVFGRLWLVIALPFLLVVVVATAMMTTRW